MNSKLGDKNVDEWHGALYLLTSAILLGLQMMCAFLINYAMRNSVNRFEWTDRERLENLREAAKDKPMEQLEAGNQRECLSKTMEWIKVERAGRRPQTHTVGYWRSKIICISDSIVKQRFKIQSQEYTVLTTTYGKSVLPKRN